MQKDQQKLIELIKGKKVAFIGAGVSHKTLIKEFVELGAHVTLCDQKKSVEDFGDYAATIKELGIDLSLGENYLDGFKGQDIIMRTPGFVGYFEKPLQDAMAAGTMVTSEVELFFDFCPCEIVAVTGSDEDNLVACQIAKREFGVDRTVARASNPKNRELLHTLGVDTVVCGTDNLSHILEREIETDTIRQLLSLGGGTASLNEILLPENFLYAGKAIMDIPIPGDTILISITRDTEFIIPHGSTILLPWDHILCLTRDDSLHELTEAWGLSDK